jgi:integrase
MKKNKRGFGMVYQPTYRDGKTGERKTSSIWWVQVSFRGKRRRVNSRSRHYADAVALLNRLKGEMSRGRLVTPSIEKTRFADLVQMLQDDYFVSGRKSTRTMEGSVKALRDVFGDDFARDITLDRLNGYVVQRLKTGRKPATIRNELAALKRAFKLAERAGKAVCPAFPTLTVRNVRTGFFEESEFQAVLAGLPEDIKSVAEFAYLTGWRRGEIPRLEWRQVDFRGGVIRLDPGSTKNDEGRVFPFAGYDSLARLLRDQRERAEAVERTRRRIIRWVFHRNGKPIQDLRGAWERACIGAGFYRVVNPEAPPAQQRKKATKLLHDFRRTAVRNLERAGVPRSVAMKLTGHKTENIYRRYAIVSEADLAEGVKKLDLLLQSTAPARTVVPMRTASNRAKTPSQSDGQSAPLAVGADTGK